MHKLEWPLEETMESILTRINNEYRNENYKECINILKGIWDLLPEPKEAYDDSFHIVLYLSDLYILVGDIKNARVWADEIYKCGLDRYDTGERELLSGKVAYESGDFEMAKNYFSIAYKKSEGRCFYSEDKKYLKFLKGKQ